MVEIGGYSCSPMRAVGRQRAAVADSLALAETVGHRGIIIRAHCDAPFACRLCFDDKPWFLFDSRDRLSEFVLVITYA